MSSRSSGGGRCSSTSPVSLKRRRSKTLVSSIEPILDCQAASLPKLFILIFYMHYSVLTISCPSRHGILQESDGIVFQELNNSPRMFPESPEEMEVRAMLNTPLYFYPSIPIHFDIVSIPSIRLVSQTRFEPSMLSRITARSFFALLCLWVAALAVLASPLPPSTHDSKEAAPVFFGPPRPPVTVDLQILIYRPNTPIEHFLIAIGDTITHASSEVIPAQEGCLTPEIKNIPLEIAMQKYTPEFIGKALFVDDLCRSTEIYWRDAYCEDATFL
ncbi:hypothetical protein GG344DRAFT_75603 [Lentinula edodes]|nr:hypothetical protein GG344DRAFT_75603 [Lentinula edodes]